MPRKEEIPPLQIRCKSEDTKIAFKVLCAKLGRVSYEEALKRLLELEKEHPLQKKVQGIIKRL